MFKLDNKFIKEDVPSGGSTINRNGCYEGVIEKFSVYKADGKFSQSEAVNLTVVDDEGKKAWFSLWYKKKDGTDVEFNLRHLNHLCYLVGINAPKPANDGTVPEFIGKRIGFAITVDVEEVDKDKLGYKYNLVGFYDSETKQTAKEKSESTNPDFWVKQGQRFLNAEEVSLSLYKKKDTTTPDGFFPMDNSDVPF